VTPKDFGPGDVLITAHRRVYSVPLGRWIYEPPEPKADVTLYGGPGAEGYSTTPPAPIPAEQEK
jgi:hypothetical protein